MKNWLIKHFGASWKTTIVSYFLAALVAVQPMLDEQIDFTDKASRTRYIWKLLFAVGIAIFGRWTASTSQVKAVDNKVEQIDKQGTQGGKMALREAVNQKTVKAPQKSAARNKPTIKKKKP